MKKISVVFGCVVLALILSGCSVNEEVKEIMVIHEHHIYVHNVNQMNRFNPGMMRRPMPGQKFNQSKGIDPRYDHKPGQQRPNRRLNQSKGIDPRYDHKPGMMPPKKDEKPSNK